MVKPLRRRVRRRPVMLTRLWSAIYAACVELLAVERLISLGADRQNIIKVAVPAACR